MNDKADLGFIGLGVMGRNLVLNMADHGFKVAVFNRTTSAVDEFINNEAADSRIVAAYSLQELLSCLKPPRKVMLMIKAGPAVDAILKQLVPLMEKGDIIIDGGNSLYKDTTRRVTDMRSKGLLYVGCGVSGGEEGARRGPSLMPGGNAEAWPHIKNILQTIAAKVADNSPCCEWVGEGGAGHFVKMVHNGIEYGDMQLICEAYDLMKSIPGLEIEEISSVFNEWNNGKLNSYLIEITRNILAFKDETDAPLVEKILDTAGQKGTGKWTVGAALDYGVPLTLIGEAVFARFLSALKEERRIAAEILAGPKPFFDGDKNSFIADIGEAMYAAKIISYTQGYMLLKTASEKYDWQLNYGAIAMVWRDGCIIRAAFLGKIKEAYDTEPELANLLLAPYFKEQVESAQSAWRRIIAQAAENGIPLPAMSNGLIFYDGYRRKRLPANLLQAQRDYFGAHTYERRDRPRGEFFHTDWTGREGEVTSDS